MRDPDDIPRPEGNGDPDCFKCRGRGVVSIEIDGWPGGGAENCDCVFKRDLVANVKRVWPVLLTVDSVESSPLLGLANQSVWITASNYTLRRHLRYVAFRQGTRWDARVVADATLITAWLATAKNVKDPDVLTQREDGEHDRPSDHYMTLVDLAVPFDLLIIRLGVKAAKNKEMPNVLAEALNEREQVGKPTWVVDSPHKPLGVGHICYNDIVSDILDGYRRVILPEEHSAVQDEMSAYRKKNPEILDAAVRTPAAEGLGGGTYRTRMYNTPSQPVAPPTTPPPPVKEPDADDCSAEALIAGAVDLVPEGARQEPEIPDTAYDIEEMMSDYPSAEDMVTNGTPSWLSTRFLTADERKASKKKGGRK